MFTHRDETVTHTDISVVGEALACIVNQTPYLLIRTELCGKTLKQWLEKHPKRKRKRMLIFFEQVCILISPSMVRSTYGVQEPSMQKKNKRRQVNKISSNYNNYVEYKIQEDTGMIILFM